MDTCKRMWSKDEIGNMAGGATYRHLLSCVNNSNTKVYMISVYSSKSDAITTDYVLANRGCLVGAISVVYANDEGLLTFDRIITSVDAGPEGFFTISGGAALPTAEVIKILSDTFVAL